MESEDSVVATAPSVEEAIIVGLTRLMATREEVEIEVLDEGSRGFLGVGSRDARVRLTRRSEDSLEEEEAPAPVEAGKPQVSAAVTLSPAEDLESDAPAQPEEVEPQAAPTGSEAQVSGGSGVGEEVGLDRAALASAVTEIASHLLPGLNVNVSVEWLDEERPTLWVALNGRDADSLVGPHGNNLHALQYLFRTLLYRRLDGEYNVVVDADGYRKRRRLSLEALARKKADQAVKSGRTVRLRAMPSDERRIIHITLRQDERVYTESVGQGRDRAVTIVPKQSADSSGSS